MVASIGRPYETKNKNRLLHNHEQVTPPHHNARAISALRSYNVPTTHTNVFNQVCCDLGLAKSLKRQSTMATLFNTCAAFEHFKPAKTSHNRDILRIWQLLDCSLVSEDKGLWTAHWHIFQTILFKRVPAKLMHKGEG